MKLITAIISPHKLDEVREALIAVDVARITVSRCTGRARAEGIQIHRGQQVAPALRPKVRIDIACNDEFVDPAIAAILLAARHGEGEQGDGKIWVTALERCIRIRTGEEGSAAI
jgi:nitrogen regulatory protein P-II 1